MGGVQLLGWRVNSVHLACSLATWEGRTSDLSVLVPTGEQGIYLGCLLLLGRGPGGLDLGALLPLDGGSRDPKFGSLSDAGLETHCHGCRVERHWPQVAFQCFVEDTEPLASLIIVKGASCCCLDLANQALLTVTL